MRRLRKWTVAALIVGILAAIFIQSNARSTLSRENQRLREQWAETKALLQEREEAGKHRADFDEVETLRNSNRELPGLRNEIGRLRRAKTEMETLRAGNERLSTALKSASPAASPAVNLPKETWIYAGLSSPEATMQSFFWAMREGDLAQLRNCFSPELVEKLKSQSDDAMRQGFQEMVREMTSLELVARKNISEDEIILGLKVAGKEAALPLKRVGSEWKIKDL